MHYSTLCYLAYAITTLISCSKDDAPSTPNEEEINQEEKINQIMPTLTLESGEDGVYLGVVGSPTQGALLHEVKAIAPDGFVSLEIFKILDGVSTSYILLDTNHPNYVAGSNTLTHQLNYILNNINEADRDLSFKAVVTDINNNTASLDFAQTDLRRPMLKKSVTIITVSPPSGDITIPYYLRITGPNVSVVNHDIAVGVDADQDIAFAFSVNDGSGFYLGSLNIVEPIISNGMQQKSTTKFKHHVNAQDLSIHSIYDIHDVHDVEHAFNVLSFNSHEQKAEQISTVGKVFYFRTDDNRTGVFQVVSFGLKGNYASLKLDMYVTE